METVKKISDLDPQFLPLLEQLFSTSITQPAAAEIVLRTPEPESEVGPLGSDGVPLWCNVLEGMSEQDIANFDAILKTPVRLARE